MTAKRLVHVTRMPIRWGDMDPMGHVNNTIYFRYIEQARIEWFTQMGCTPNPNESGPVIINAHCTFLRQLKYPGDIEVLTFVGELGRSSLRLSTKSGASTTWRRSPLKAAPRWSGSIFRRKSQCRCRTKSGAC